MILKVSKTIPINILPTFRVPPHLLFLRSDQGVQKTHYYQQIHAHPLNQGFLRHLADLAADKPLLLDQQAHHPFLLFSLGLLQNHKNPKGKMKLDKSLEFTVYMYSVWTKINS